MELDESTEKMALSSAPNKTPIKDERPVSKSTLLKAKRSLDKAMADLNGFPEFWEEARQLREKVLDRYVDEERKLPGK